MAAGGADPWIEETIDRRIYVCLDPCKLASLVLVQQRIRMKSAARAVRGSPEAPCSDQRCARPCRPGLGKQPSQGSWTIVQALRQNAAAGWRPAGLRQASLHPERASCSESIVVHWLSTATAKGILKGVPKSSGTAPANHLHTHCRHRRCFVRNGANLLRPHRLT